MGVFIVVQCAIFLLRPAKVLLDQFYLAIVQRTLYGTQVQSGADLDALAAGSGARGPLGPGGDTALGVVLFIVGTGRHGGSADLRLDEVDVSAHFAGRSIHELASTRSRALPAADTAL